MLVLPIKGKWFDMILAGEKKEEYRNYSPYWIKRLQYWNVGANTGRCLQAHRYTQAF